MHIAPLEQGGGSLSHGLSLVIAENINLSMLGLIQCGIHFEPSYSGPLHDVVITLSSGRGSSLK